MDPRRALSLAPLWLAPAKAAGFFMPMKLKSREGGGKMVTASTTFYIKKTEKGARRGKASFFAKLPF